jgi:hypothetical protein
MRAYVRELKQSNPCGDCGDLYPRYVMDFDHRDGSEKSDIVSQLINQLSWRRLREEIAKCDLVCSNCHRIRTHERAGAKTEQKSVEPNLSA